LVIWVSVSSGENLAVPGTGSCWTDNVDNATVAGARMLDREPGRIVRRLSRRDEAAFSDTLTIILDPYDDHMTGAILTVSAAGALSDSLVANDTQTDASWDGVWEAAVSIDAGGWVAEIRIPLSQLRFAPGARQTWGFNISRYLQRRVESSYWNPLGANESRLISRCGHLDDGGLRSRQRVEPFTNYFAARVRRELGQRAAIGGIATQVTRDLSDPALSALLPRHAVTGGADAYLYLGGGRDWVLNGALTGSRVSGDAAAISRLQHASARYFQRPDAPHIFAAADGQCGTRVGAIA